MYTTKWFILILGLLSVVACSSSAGSSSPVSSPVTAISTLVTRQIIETVAAGPTADNPGAIPTSTVTPLVEIPANSSAGIEQITPPAVTLPAPAAPVVTPPAIAAPQITPPAMGTPESVTAVITNITDVPLPLPKDDQFRADVENVPSTVNIELLFDASGSMGESVGRETKIAAARRAMNRAIDILPLDVPDLNVGFRIFGHAGGPSEAQKPASCASTELLVPVAGVDEPLLRRQAAAWQPNGWTPIALALEAAGADLPAGENVNNVVVLVTDGEETCGGDPADVAAQLAQADIALRVDVVGFDLDAATADTLRAIAAAGGGVYYDAQDGDALAAALEETIRQALDRSALHILAYGPDGDLSGDLRLRTIENEAGEEIISQGPLFANALEDGDARFQLPSGHYQFGVELYAGPFQEAFQAYQNVITYRAVLEPRLETTAVIGAGGLTLHNKDVAASRACWLQLDVQTEDGWQTIIPAGNGLNCIGSLDFDTAVPLLPGRYRLRDGATDDDAILLDEMEIRPGRTLDVEIALNAGGQAVRAPITDP